MSGRAERNWPGSRPWPGSPSPTRWPDGPGSPGGDGPVTPEILLGAALLFGAGLALVACWRLCADLQRLPAFFGAWATALPTTGVFLAGIDVPLPILQAVLGPPADRLWLAVGIVAVGGAYLSMLLEAASKRPWRRLRRDWAAGRRRQALARIPAPATALALTAIAFALGISSKTQCDPQQR